MHLDEIHMYLVFMTMKTRATAWASRSSSMLIPQPMFGDFPCYPFTLRAVPNLLEYINLYFILSVQEDTALQSIHSNSKAIHVENSFRAQTKILHVNQVSTLILDVIQ